MKITTDDAVLERQAPELTSLRTILDEVMAAARAVVTMTHTARSRLLDIYGASPEKSS